jgi:Fe2+ or Zn2+ uptake regulation protein
MIISKKILQILQGNNYRLTKGRLAVLQVMTAHPYECLTTRQIYACSVKVLSSISVPTVYRVVSLFCSLHILHKLRINVRGCFYELIEAGKEKHPYCVCRQCGKIFSIFDTQVLKAFSNCEQEINNSYNFQIETTNLIYYGICKTCHNKKD